MAEDSEVMTILREAKQLAQRYRALTGKPLGIMVNEPSAQPEPEPTEPEPEQVGMIRILWDYAMYRATCIQTLTAWRLGG